MSLAALTLIVLVGLLGPALASLPGLRAPVVVGEVLGGVACGPSGLGWLHPESGTATLLSGIGFALLMLILGTHLPLGDQQLRGSIPRAAAVVLVTFAVAAPLAWVTARLTSGPRFLPLALLLVGSSAAVALPILREQKVTGPAVTLTMAWISVADIASILAVPLVASTGSSIDVTGGALLVIGGALLLAVIGHQIDSTPKPAAIVHRIRKASKKRGWALDLRLALLALLALSALAQHFGTSLLVPGFAVGVAVASFGGPKRFSQQLIGIGEGFFVPVFFVLLGARLDVHQLASSPRAILLGVLLLVGSTVLHLLAAAAMRLPAWCGLLASAQMGVPAAVAALGLNGGWLSGAQAAAVLAAALGSLVVAAVGARLSGHQGPLSDRSRAAVVGEDYSPEIDAG